MSPEYNETQVRREFIDPFFEALGWDIQNRQGYSEQFKQVVHEDSLKIGGVTKAPDYSFRLGGRRIFFVEAKKPAINLKTDPSPAYQLRRYAWTAKLPVSILTDFEEFIVYDTRVKPAEKDEASTARTFYISYTDYIDKWHEIDGLFSPAAIQKGALDRYVESSKKKKGTAEVDDAFLAEIEEWRDLLARNIALRNRGLSARELNFAVQATIDRIVFLRICEDRGIEPYGQLMALLSGDDTYARLRVLFERADERYNSGLFHFHSERDRHGAPDKLTPNLAIDDKALKAIFKRLYYPESPYEFAVFPAEILGQVYERFLGSVIRLTAGGQAKVEQKPEVRKAGGVYYTPSYIVDYIVKHTVGKLLEGKTPQEVAGMTETWRPSKTGQPLAILDPACGSGSFLLGAYQCLLDWHREYYAQDADAANKWATGKIPRVYQDRHGEWRLTTSERKRILLANIYGVDLDTQAVEVTKLSLLLRVLEGEDVQLGQGNLRFAQKHMLPDLAGNIKCGNSLIGPDFCQNQQMTLDDEETYRINAFNWGDEFPDIMRAGGFDAVIGNPPYIRIQTLKQWAPAEVEFYKDHYRAAASGNYDIYVVFIEKGLALLNENGRLGFICPHKFFNAKYGEGIRRVIAEGKHLEHVVHFAQCQVFADATTYTCLLFLSQTSRNAFSLERVRDIGLWIGSAESETGRVKAPEPSEIQWSFVIGLGGQLLAKLPTLPGCAELGQLTSRIFQGFKTGADPVFILEQQDEGLLYSKAVERSVVLEAEFLRPLYKSGQLKRYDLKAANRLIVCPYRGSSIVPWQEIESLAPKTASYLLTCRHILDAREGGRWAGQHWYCYSRQQALSVMNEPKILTADLNPHASFCFDPTGSASFTGGAAGGYGVTFASDVHLYVLGLLNSKLLDWVLKQVSSPFRGNWYSFESRFISRLPIRITDTRATKQRARHDKMVTLVERMLDLHKRLQGANTGHERTMIERQIAATDTEIDQLVYELYDLTAEEIAIVEESTGK